MRLKWQAYESFGGLQAVTDHPTMWVGLGLLKEKMAHQPDVTAVKRRRLLSQVWIAVAVAVGSGACAGAGAGAAVDAGAGVAQVSCLYVPRLLFLLLSVAAAAFCEL